MPFLIDRKTLEISNLHISPLKFRPFWQKNRGPTETILHFFSRFSGFWAFFPLQAIAVQPQAPIQPLPKKSCLKHYLGFNGCSRMCHIRRMNVEMTGRNEGCERGMAICRQPALMLKSDNPQRPSPSYRSHSVPLVPFVPFVPSRRFDETGKTSSSIKANQTQSNLIKPNQLVAPTCPAILSAIALATAEASATADGEGGSDTRPPSRCDPARFACNNSGPFRIVSRHAEVRNKRL